MSTHARRKLLFLLPFPPRLDATHGGGKVTAQLLFRLASRHEVALLYLRGAHEPALDERLQAQCAWTEEVLRGWTKQTASDDLIRNSRLLLSLLGGRPMWVTDWHSRRYAERLRAAVKTWQPDIVQAEFHIMGQYFADAGHAQPRVIVEHEPGSRAAPFLKRAVPLINDKVVSQDRAAWRRYEHGILQQASAIVVFTTADRAALSMNGSHPPVFVVPFGAELPAQTADPVGSTPPSLLFVGNFLHPPNSDAALWLASEIFPLLKDEFSTLKLFIVGDAPPLALRQLAGERIIVTGRVPEVKPFLDAATVVVAPLRAGGGMRVKVLEALAAGKAVVATSLAAEGLAVNSGEHLLVGDTAQAIAQHIAALLRDPVRRRALAICARGWAERHAGWENCVAAYEAMYDALLLPAAGGREAQP
jgi:glycosyltransferase involved in cell wall biosynthesis